MDVPRRENCPGIAILTCPARSWTKDNCGPPADTINGCCCWCSVPGEAEEFSMSLTKTSPRSWFWGWGYSTGIDLAVTLVNDDMEAESLTNQSGVLPPSHSVQLCHQTDLSTLTPLIQRTHQVQMAHLRHLQSNWPGLGLVANHNLPHSSHICINQPFCTGCSR